MLRELLRKTFYPVLLASALLIVNTAASQDLTVMSSGGFEAPFKLLTPKYVSATGTHVQSIWGPSMGTTPGAIPMRLSRNEPADVVIMARSELDSLAKKGIVVEGSQVNLVNSRIGMAVKAGSHIPDISTVTAFKQTLLQAKSIAYSDSASGVYISSEMYKRLGAENELAPKSKRILAEPVGGVVARGEAEIGFQQMSELKPISGIAIVGPIPDELQKITIFAAGIVASSQHQDSARSLIQFLASPSACALIAESGLEPLACSTAHQ
jgi:molybdate transport system substrate-binding protein